MRSELLQLFSARYEELVGTGRFQNFRAQSQSRDVLRYLGTSEEEWPNYVESLDEDLVYTARYLLYIGIHLKNNLPTHSKGIECLTLGAEILEHVYGLNDESEDPERVLQLFSASLAYYIAGHFARAFVLMRDIENEQEVPRFARPIRHLLLKDFRQLRDEVLSVLLSPEFSDENISSGLEAGQLGDGEAFCLVFEATIYRSLSHFVEHFKSGEPTLLTTAEELLDLAIELALEQRFADWWWYCSCIKSMILTYKVHSFWTNLQPLIAKETSQLLAERYIGTNLKLSTPIVELWPSQLTAIPFILNNSNNLCLRMPTSSGKTKIAELAILKFLSDFEDDPDTKCVYVAPFRALAVEVEQTLRKIFSPFGIRVSELYGGFELTLADKALIERTLILVATPEKLDALIRFSPEIVTKLKLVIIDEGHIISEPNFENVRQSRGLKYEVFLQRLVKRFEKSNSRIVFLSAVMPNAEQFSEWITGGTSGLVVSNWRPSRLMLGEAIWDGTAVSLEYTHAEHSPLGSRCFVRRFVSQTPAKDLFTRGRKKPFPKDGSEAVALTALEFAKRGMTMVFVARKSSSEPLGRAVLECIKLGQKMKVAAGSSLSLPIEENHRAGVAQCLGIIREHMGDDSELASFLQAGFVVHHGGLPQPVRIALERLVRAGAVRLVIATTTLAQGVNFPIHTVLVHSLDHGYQDSVSPMDFWNICGRAGRGMKENEGQVLFFVNNSYSEWEASKKKAFRRCNESWKRRQWGSWVNDNKIKRGNYISAYGNYEIKSALLCLLHKLFALWSLKHPTVNIPELCEALANHRLDAFGVEDGIDLPSILSSFDGLLISIVEETEAEDITPDVFDDLFHRSLLYLQLKSDNQRRGVSRIFSARYGYIKTKHDDKSKRLRFYQLGLPLSDCEKVEALQERLLSLYLTAAHYSDWNAEQRTELLADVAGALFELDEIKPSGVLPVCWREVLHLWLTGLNPKEIAQDVRVLECDFSAHDISRWIDDVCWYRLPWGYNMLSIFLAHASQAGGIELPPICEYFSSFAKFGVHEPVACWLLTFGVQSRTTAIRASRLVSDDISGPNELFEWLQSGGLEQLRNSGLDDESLKLIAAALNGSEDETNQKKTASVSIRLIIPDSQKSLTSGSPLILRHIDQNNKDSLVVYNINGKLIARYDIGSTYPDLWKLLEQPELVLSMIRSVEWLDGQFVATISAQSV